MITIAITPEIRIEILQTIAHYESRIAKENSISADLRYYEVIEKCEKEIAHFEKALEIGFI